MLRISNLHKSFGDIRAVDGLSLEINRGEVFGLLGPNGAGKTTTVNIAVGLLTPDSGNVEIAGYGSPADRSVRRIIGVAPQALSLYDELTAEENVAFFGRIAGMPGVRLREQVKSTLEFVDLYDRRKEAVSTYSGGMKRRLNLAVAMVHDPELLFLDEPTVGVDPQSRNAIFEKVLALRERGRTIVYTTHYMEEAQRLCDRVGIIDHGRLLALDTVEGLLKTYGGQRVLVAERLQGEVRVPTDDPLRELNRLQAESQLLSFRLETPDLESVFLKLTGRLLRD
ncbi:MAG TPA: ABC transporter ATP-binding protein [Acidobacteriota bacterium]|nr:ABC transporter ATP-binding protein [Acidobacteriota bacterium]